MCEVAESLHRASGRESPLFLSAAVEVLSSGQSADTTFMSPK